jgi:hypothetical protein
VAINVGCIEVGKRFITVGVKLTFWYAQTEAACLWIYQWHPSIGIFPIAMAQTYEDTPFISPPHLPYLDVILTPTVYNSVREMLS